MNIFIFGYGSIAKRHIKNIKSLYSNYKIYVVRHSKNLDDNNFDYVNKEFIEDIFYSYDEALEYLIPDIAFICNPAPYHIDISLKLAEKKVNLFIEKPISVNLDNIKKLINICHENNLILQIGYMTRFSQSLQYVKNLIDNQKYGKILSATCCCSSYLPNWRKSHDYSKDVTANNNLGGGVLLELSHEIDYLKWILGDIQNINCKYNKISNLKIDVEDNVDMLLTFKNDIFVSLHLDMISRYNKREFVVNCENATIIWDGLDFNVKIITDKDSDIINFDENRNKIFINQMEHFFSCISKKNSPRVTGEDGEYILKILEYVKSSNLEKKELKINNKKNVIITGSSGFIGSSIKKYLQNDYNIITCDINDIENKVDATDEEQIINFFRKIKTEYEDVPILINSLGIPDSSDKLNYQKLIDIDTKSFKSLIDINLSAIFVIIREYVRNFNHCKGNIINLSSMYSEISPRLDLYDGKIKHPGYIASKSGLVGLTKYLAVLVSNQNIKINCIAPGCVSDLYNNNNKDFLKKYNKNVPLNKPVKMTDIFKAINLLIHNDNITGQNMLIDGGYTLI